MDLCFVIMPYTAKPHTKYKYPSNHWDEVFEKLIKPSVEKAGLECRRADKTQTTTIILPDILDNIERSKVILCDMSTNNPNVLWELGWGFGARKPVVLIRDECTVPTFDLAQVSTFLYPQRLEPSALPSLIQEVTGRILHALREANRLHPLPRTSLQTHIGLGGITAFYQSRSFLGRDWWERFYSSDKSPKKVLLMGQSISKAFSNERQAAAFVKWCNHGAVMRVLLLSPENTEVHQLQSVGGGIKVCAGESWLDPSEYLKTKIYDTIDILSRSVTQKVPVLANKPMVRFASRDMPFSVMAVDDDMVVTFYGTEPEADNQPTLLIQGEQTEAFRSFRTEFDRIWDGYSKVVPYADPVLTPFRKHWKKCVNLRDYDVTLDPPMQAIIYPTYRCTANCSYCMYRTERHEDPTTEMMPEVMGSTLRKLFDVGVRRFEISGGGEPLEHKFVDDILDCIREFVEARLDIRIGLLTNGRHLLGRSDKLLGTFNDYIRVSRYEGLMNREESEAASSWRQGIRELLRAKRRNVTPTAKIGVKYLLTPENADGFVQMVSMDLGDQELLNVDHFRFRSDRRTDPTTVTCVEQQLYYLLEEAGLTGQSDRVSLSLPNLVYPRNFRCWVSPMNVVIAPDQCVYVCCNYARHRNDKCLGNMGKTSFEDIWNSERHKAVRRSLTRAHCEWQDYCNCRYAEIQGMFETIAFAVGTEKGQ